MEETEVMDPGTSGVPEDQGAAAVSDDFTGAATPDVPAAPEDNGHSDDFDPTSVDLMRTKADEVPEQHRPFFETWQKMGKGLQQSIEQRVKEQYEAQSAEVQRRAEEAEQKYLDRLERLQSQPAAQTDPYATLSPEEQQGVEVVRNIVGEQIGQLQTLPETVSTLQQQVEALTNYIQQQNQKAIHEEIAAVESDPDFQNYQQPVMALMAQTNPLTSKHYTAQEAFDLLTGKTAAKAAEMREKDAEIRGKAKRKVAGPVTIASDIDEGGDMSQSEALAAMENLFA